MYMTTLNLSKKAVMAIALMMVAAGCSHSRTRNSEPRDVSSMNDSTGSNKDQPRTSAADENASTDIDNKVAQEADANYYVEIKFQPGSSNLSEDSKQSISELMSRARGQGSLDSVKVLSWADEEFPAASRKKLSDAQRKLASARGKAIEDYIDSMKLHVDVDNYNMAEQPNAIARWFNTPDARFKKSMVAAGLPTTSESPQFPSKASHSVILVKLK
jgi:hypothetical protein